MRNDHNSLVADQLRQGFLNHRLVIHIQGSRRFIQQDNGRILQERSRYGDTLSLTAGQFRTVLADHGLPAVRQFFRELITMRQLCGCQHFFVCGILFTDTDIFHDRSVEQRHVLKYDGIQGHQRLRINRGDIHTAYRDLTLFDVPETGG